VSTKSTTSAGLPVAARSAQRVEERAAPLRQGAPGEKPKARLPSSGPRSPSAGSAKPEDRSAEGRRSACPSANSRGGRDSDAGLDLHLRHVHAGGAFAPAALHDTHRSSVFEHFVGREGLGPQLPDSARRSVFARRASRASHRRLRGTTGTSYPRSKLAAVPVVVAHLDRRREPRARGARTLHSLQSSTASNFGTA